MKAICLVSGGMDSLVTAAIAHQKGYQLTFLHIDYGQNTSKKELSCFKKIAKFYKADMISIKIPYYRLFGGNALLNPKLKSITNKKNPITYVPFRNANFLTIAVALGEVINATSIFIGAVDTDTGYPDCTPKFYKDFNKLIKSGTINKKIKVITPIINLDKSQIIKMAIKLKAPLELSWSCYFNSIKACGTCDSCLLRLKAFKQARIKDPIPYQ